ncbi:hypothetical protein OG474_08095 [Kribbella sp. NBC_01505]|uniref:hypothetical protein n=1 Tax=Kribbella sp. NBC_01505 TaxID=2903580 RepID=UPI003866D08B
MEYPIAQDDLVQVELRRSGFVDWNYLAGGADGLIELAVALVAWLINWFVHCVVFWGGWTLRVWEVGDDDMVRLIHKQRYRRKRHALADVDRQLREGRASLGEPEVS